MGEHMKPIPKSWERNLIRAAIDERKAAFSPFSGAKVGVAVLTKEGYTLAGSNVEFTRSMNIHAEMNVLSAVLKHYITKDKATIQNMREGFSDIIAIAEVNSEGIPGCGACRQAILEVNPDMIFYGVKPDGTIVVKKKITELVPNHYRSNDNLKL